MRDLQLFFLNGLDPGTILKRWGEKGKEIARSSLLFDFAYMPGYAFFAASTLLLLAHCSQGWVHTACVFGSLLPFGAWVFDIVENLATLRLLATPDKTLPSRGLLALMQGATSLKWFFLALTGILTLVALGTVGKACLRRWRKPASQPPNGGRE